MEQHPQDGHRAGGQLGVTAAVMRCSGHTILVSPRTVSQSGLPANKKTIKNKGVENDGVPAVSHPGATDSLSASGQRRRSRRRPPPPKRSHHRQGPEDNSQSFCYDEEKNGYAHANFIMFTERKRLHCPCPPGPCSDPEITVQGDKFKTEGKEKPRRATCCLRDGHPRGQTVDDGTCWMQFLMREAVAS